MDTHEMIIDQESPTFDVVIAEHRVVDTEPATTLGGARHRLYDGSHAVAGRCDVAAWTSDTTARPPAPLP